MKNKSAGFTLVEVLVASTILFATIASVSLIYKSSYLASEKAESRLAQAGIVSILLKNIQQDIRTRTQLNVTSLQNNGEVFGFKYKWQANIIDFKAPADKFDRDTGKIESFDKKYILWQVYLTLGEGKSIREFEYQELSWL